MKWLRALWQAILAFFSSIKSDNIQEQQEAQHTQDAIVQETQHEIEEIPTKTDDELLDIAESTGLVQCMHSKDSDRSSGSEPKSTDPYTRCGSSFKAKH